MNKNEADNSAVQAKLESGPNASGTQKGGAPLAATEKAQSDKGVVSSSATPGTESAPESVGRGVPLATENAGAGSAAATKNSDAGGKATSKNAGAGSETATKNAGSETTTKNAGADTENPGKNTWSNVLAVICVLAVLGLNVWVFMGSRDDSSAGGGVRPSVSDMAGGAPMANSVGAGNGATGTGGATGAANLPGPGEEHPPQPGVVTEPHPEGGRPDVPEPKRGAQKPGEVLPGPGVTPAPPAPTHAQGAAGPAGAQGQIANATPNTPPAPRSENMPRNLSGPQLLLGVSVLSSTADMALSSSQKRKLAAIMVKMDEVQQGLAEVTTQALAYLSPEQTEWMIQNRGPAVIKEGVVEPGMDPITSAASTLLRGKATRQGKAELHKVTTHELLFHDMLNGILRLETEAPKIAVDGAQAQALLPLLLKANQARRAETQYYGEIYGILSEEQVKYLEAHPELVRMDVNSVILHYVQKTLE